MAEREEYNQAVTILNEIVDEIVRQETYPLADLAEALPLFIETYEDAYIIALNGPFGLQADPTAPC